MKNKKLLKYLNKLLYSNIFVFVILNFFKKFNLKPEIDSHLFFLVIISLFFIIYYRKIIYFIILSINRLVYIHGFSKPIIINSSLKNKELIAILFKESLIFFKSLSLFLKVLFRNYLFRLILIISIIFLEIFLLKSALFFLTILLIFLLVLLAIFDRPKAEIFIGLGIFLIFVCPFLLFNEKEIIADKTALWAYIFLTIGSLRRLLKK